MKESTNPHYIFADFFKKQTTKILAYELVTKLQEGHICLDRTHFEKPENLLENPFYNEIDTPFSIQEIIEDTCVSDSPDALVPFIFYNNKFYIQRYFAYENEILSQIKVFVANENPTATKQLLEKHESFIKDLFSGYKADALLPEENIQWQCVAAISAIINNFSIITGGPGTGKTTTVAKVLAILYTLYPNCKVALAAPTGKAAARMKESLLFAKDTLGISDEIKNKFGTISSGTLHRLLGYIKDSLYFKHNASNTLNYDIVIVDESSMIGTTMMAKFLTAIKPTTKVIFLGDQNQLASVEAGSIFGDICLTQTNQNTIFSKEKATFINQFITVKDGNLSSAYIEKKANSNLLHEHIVELKRSYRFKGEEAIGVFSKAIVTGELTTEIIKQCAHGTGQSVKLVGYSESKQIEKLFDHYEEYIKEPKIEIALKKLNNVKILCAVREGNFGIAEYNDRISGYLQAKGLLQVNPAGFYENQPILITKNTPALNLFNGDIGIVRKNEKGDYIVYFEGSDALVEIPSNRIDSYQTVFAMTIHKSQGSEFKQVGLVLPDDENLPILTRELIYTGITRAKEGALIIGTEAVLQKGVSRQVERASGITSRIIHNN